MIKGYNDSINLLSKISSKKLANAWQVYTSYFSSKSFNSYKVPYMPYSMAFEPTTSCNLRCPECPSGLRSFTRPTGMMDEGLFKDQIDQLREYLIYLTFYFQGEPYLNNQFLDMVSYASKQNIYTSTSTNAHFLTKDIAEKTVESGLDRLIVSIDGTSQESYEKYRIGGSLDKVLEGTKNIVSAKQKLKSKTPHIIFQYLVVRHNEHEIEDAKKLASEMNVDDIHFKTAQIYDYQTGSELIPENEKYSRYKKEKNGSYALKNPLNNHCWKMWHSCVITWDGRVVPCCFDKDAHHVMGNLQEESFQNIWNNHKYNQFRKSILKSRSEIDICTNCSEGLQVFSA